MPPAVSRLNSQLSQEDFGTDTSVGTEAVAETDGQLDPKLREGGERPDRNQSNRFKDQTTGINPFYFPQLLRKIFTSIQTGQNLFSRGFFKLKKNI